ncbi:hypothetical protein, partial [Pseudomonas aeruginosa]|uniref:hypothetical protein n=1 Tax=Pseudomonas aeruginosa TaxID=287 RepID=UPI001ED9AC99
MGFRLLPLPALSPSRHGHHPGDPLEGPPPGFVVVSVTLFSSLKRFSFTCKDLIIRKLTIVL